MQIIFFDGICGLCNRAVDLIIACDHQKIFYFAPLQGDTARQKLPFDLRENLKTFILWDDGKIYTKTAAAIEVGIRLGGLVKFIAVFTKIIPAFIFDFFYDRITTNRYAWFGRRETCRLATEDEQERFLG